jgi:hypothetical protein
VARGYLAGRSSGPPLTFGQSWLERGRNPTPEALITLAGRFDNGWSTELAAFLEADDQRFYREISFLVGIGTVKALVLKEVSCEAADWFIARFNPVR